MHQDTQKVLKEVKEYFESMFGEEFTSSKDIRDEYVIYKSNSYYFIVWAAFVQARILAILASR